MNLQCAEGVVSGSKTKIDAAMQQPSCGAWVWDLGLRSDAAATERVSRRWIADRAATPT